MMTVFDARFSYLLSSFRCADIAVRCTFEINQTAILYQYCGALHLASLIPFICHKHSAALHQLFVASQTRKANHSVAKYW
jgi:hypothetical protein